jgi:ribosomal protein S18 acetylase RimI-like enzyme
MCKKELEVQLRDLSIDDNIQSEELRNRAGRNPATDHRLRFLLLQNKQEVGYLSFDLWPSENYIVLYELYILSEFRRKGIGTTVLNKAEKIGIDLGNSLILLKPEPLSADITKTDLINWYIKIGYSPWTENPKLFAKKI